MKNSNDNWKIYIVGHQKLYDNMYSGDKLFSGEHYEILNVGEKGQIDNPLGLRQIDQKTLPTFVSLGKWWTESEGIYNLWLDGRWRELDYIGFIHYDLELRLDPRVKGIIRRSNITERVQKYLDMHSKAHISFETHNFSGDYNQKIMADVDRPNDQTGDGMNCYDYILNDYNQFFGTNKTISELSNRGQINLCSCFLIDVEHFDEMMKWWNSVINSHRLEQFDTNHEYRIHGGLAERYFGVYLALNYDELCDLSLIHHYNDGIK